MLVSNDSVVVYKVGPAWYNIAFYMNGIDDSDGPENGPEAVNIPLPQPDGKLGPSGQRDGQ